MFFIPLMFLSSSFPSFYVCSACTSTFLILTNYVHVMLSGSIGSHPNTIFFFSFVSKSTFFSLRALVASTANAPNPWQRLPQAGAPAFASSTPRAPNCVSLQQSFARGQSMGGAVWDGARGLITHPLRSGRRCFGAQLCLVSMASAPLFPACRHLWYQCQCRSDLCLRSLSFNTSRRHVLSSLHPVFLRCSATPAAPRAWHDLACRPVLRTPHPMWNWKFPKSLKEV